MLPSSVTDEYARNYGLPLDWQMTELERKAYSVEVVQYIFAGSTPGEWKTAGDFVFTTSSSITTS